jgi:hypothetical protein
MRNLEGRLQRIEKEVNTENELTEEALELVLSVLPQDFREAVIKELRARIEKKPAGERDWQPTKHGITKQRSGLSGKNLQSMLEIMPCEEWKEALIRKVNERG